MDASNIVYKREQEREMSYYKHPTFISKEQQKNITDHKLEQRLNQPLNIKDWTELIKGTDLPGKK